MMDIIRVATQMEKISSRHFCNVERRIFKVILLLKV